MPAKNAARRNVVSKRFPKAQETQLYLDAAYKFQKSGSHQQAELLYRKVLIAEPGNPFALYALGTIALRKGESAVAASLLRQAYQQGYTHETVLTHLGIALQANGQTDEALEVYRMAMSQDPRNPRYPSNVSVVLAQKGEYEEALAAAGMALKLDPTFAPACTNAASVLQTLGRYVEAAEMFERAVLLDPDNQEIRESLVSLRRKLSTEGS